MNYIGRACRFVRRYGLRRLYFKAAQRRRTDMLEKDYDSRLSERLPDDDETKRQGNTEFPYSPLISILVPAYETDEASLREMMDSVLAQSYKNVELCIADGSATDRVRNAVEARAGRDARLRYRRLEKNEGISGNTNACLAMARGEYVGLLDHDDFLLPGALYEIVGALNEYGAADAVYTDEDKYDPDTGRHFQPHFKPDFNLEYLRSNNYICHFFLVRRETALSAGGFRSEFDGAQDHDFIFRCTENAGRVLHIPKVLYSWRSSRSSTATNPESKLYAYDAGKRAVAAHLERACESGEVVDTENYGFYRVIYPGQLKSPGKGLENFDRQKGIEVVYYDEVCNNSVTICGSEDYILFSRIKNIGFGKGFAAQLKASADRPYAGAACARVYGRDGRLADEISPPGYSNPFSEGTRGQKRGYTGYFHMIELQMELSSPTSCFMMKRDTVLELFEDGKVDLRELPEKLKGSGRRIFYEPGAVAYEQR